MLYYYEKKNLLGEWSPVVAVDDPRQKPPDSPIPTIRHLSIIPEHLEGKFKAGEVSLDDLKLFREVFAGEGLGEGSGNQIQAPERVQEAESSLPAGGCGGQGPEAPPEDDLRGRISGLDSDLADAILAIEDALGILESALKKIRS